MKIYELAYTSRREQQDPIRQKQYFSDKEMLLEILDSWCRLGYHYYQAAEDIVFNSTAQPLGPHVKVDCLNCPMAIFVHVSPHHQVIMQPQWAHDEYGYKTWTEIHENW